jgi:hypothetical protein
MKTYGEFLTEAKANSFDAVAKEAQLGSKLPFISIDSMGSNGLFFVAKASSGETAFEVSVMGMGNKVEFTPYYDGNVSYKMSAQKVLGVPGKPVLLATKAAKAKMAEIVKFAKDYSTEIQANKKY